jgi:uncharacterized damage-inducible protein DinB
MFPETAVLNATSLPIAPLCALLDDVAAVVISLDTHTYVAAPMAPLSGSIGQHVRHLVDHVAALLQGADAAGEIDYDTRQRGTEVERDPAAAVAMMYRCSQRLRALTGRDSGERALVRSQLTRDAEPATSWSTLGREIAFVVSHTVHHQAIIALLLHADASELPRHFGLAPSTPATH